MYELGLRHHLIAAGIALGAALVLGTVAAILLPPRPYDGLFPLAIALFGGVAAGSGIAQALDRTTNRKRGTAIQLYAAAAMVGAGAVRLLVTGDLDLVTRDLAGPVFVALGVIAAWNRLA
jgi:hypothetical protein